MQGGRYGPYEDSSGNLWIVGRASTGVTVWKSTDGGASWGSAITASGSSSSGNADSVFDSANDVIYVLTVPVAGQLEVWKFTCSSSSWARFDSSTGRPTAGSGSGAGARSGIELRSDGTLVVHFQSATERIMGTDYGRTSYVTLSTSGAWGTVTAVSPTGVQLNYIAHGTALGASDRVHMFFTATGAHRHRSLSSSGTLDTDGAFSGAAAAGYAGYYYDGTLGKVVASHNNSIFRATSQANPSWAADSNNFGDADYNVSSPSFVYDTTGSKLYAVFIDNATDDPYKNTASSTTWDTAASVESAGTARDVSATRTTNGIAIRYHDTFANALYFTLISLSSGTTFNQGITANASASMAALRSIGKRVTATGSALPTFQKSASKSVTTTSTASGAVQKSVGKTITAALTSSASFLAQKVKTVAITATATASALLSRAIGKAVSTTAATTASLTRGVSTSFVASATSSSTFTKSVGKQVIASATSSAAFSATRAFLRTITASATASASFTKSIAKPVTAALTAASSSTRSVGKVIVMPATASAVLQATRAFLRTITASATASASFQKSVGLAVVAPLSAAASLTRSVGKAISASATASAADTRSVGKQIATSALATASMARSVGKQIGATATSVASIVADFISGGGQTFNQAITATTTATASVTRTVGKALVASVSTVAAFSLLVPLGAVQVVQSTRRAARLMLSRFGFYP